MLGCFCLFICECLHVVFVVLMLCRSNNSPFLRESITSPHYMPLQAQRIGAGVAPTIRSLAGRIRSMANKKLRPLYPW